MSQIGVVYTCVDPAVYPHVLDFAKKELDIGTAYLLTDAGPDFPFIRWWGKRKHARKVAHVAGIVYATIILFVGHSDCLGWRYPASLPYDPFREQEIHSKAIRLGGNLIAGEWGVPRSISARMDGKDSRAFRAADNVHIGYFSKKEKRMLLHEKLSVSESGWLWSPC